MYCSSASIYRESDRFELYNIFETTKLEEAQAKRTRLLK
uniref:Uncharacterized protein n=1 Tax=Rhizophora mucronata TaxID=61149 RepID=A0A2P2P2D6_RHIMU